MKWGVRNDPKSETRKGWLDPEGRDLTSDVVKSTLWPLFPPLGIFALPAQARLIRGGGRGVKAKAIDVNEKRFTKKAQSEKNFVEIHNRSTVRFNRDIKKVNDKHPGDLTKDPKKQKAYDADVQKLMQDTYREAAKSVGNKPNTMHLDVKFDKNGQDFKITAKPGASTPLPKQVRHAAEDEDETYTFAGKIKRDNTGHILGLEFDDFKPNMKHTAELGEEFLEHYGTKGMRWGHRKEDIERAAEGNTTNAIAKAVSSTSRFVRDVTFESTVSDKEGEGHARTQGVIRRKAEKEFRSTDLPAIKAKPEHQQAAKLKNRLLHPLDKGTRAYRKEVREAYIKQLENAANSMENASGTRQYTIREHGGDLPTSKYIWEVNSRIARHADGDDDTFMLEVLMDKDGFITGTKQVEDSVAQSDFDTTADLGAAFLAHYGTKGMKWGVRKGRNDPGFFETKRAQAEAKARVKRTPIDARVQDTIGSSKRKQTKIAAKGGEDHPATEDALRVAAATQKLKKSGVHALSNRELQEVAQRLNLETQVSVLVGKRVKKGPGAKFVEEQLEKARNDPIKTFKKANVARKAAGPAIKTGKTLFKMRRLAGSPA